MERTAFLHASDIFDARHAGHRASRAPRSENIRSLVAEGNEILVQVVKDPLGTKGARLTTYITLPSTAARLHAAGSGCRRIGADRARERARAAAVRVVLNAASNRGRTRDTSCAPPPRTPRTEALRADMLYLRKLWEFVRQTGIAHRVAGNLVHADLPLHLRVLRDMLRPGVERVLIDQPSAHREMREFAASFVPEALLERVELYSEEKRPIFELHHVEEEIHKALDRKVPLKSGGHLDHRPDRVHDDHRREHRRVRRSSGISRRRFFAPIWRRR